MYSDDAVHVRVCVRVCTCVCAPVCVCVSVSVSGFLLVFLVVESLVGHLVVFDSLLEVLDGRVHVSVLVVWTAQLHVLQHTHTDTSTCKYIIYTHLQYKHLYMYTCTSCYLYILKDDLWVVANRLHKEYLQQIRRIRHVHIHIYMYTCFNERCML